MTRADLILKLNVRKDERTVAPVETGGRISYLFRTLTGNFRTVFVVNIIYALIFGLPLLFSLFGLPILLQNIVMSGKSFIGNFGIGFPNVHDSVTEALTRLVYYHRIILYPSIIGSTLIAFFGLSGLFHVARGLLWGEKVALRSFFRGIKHLWKPFLITDFVVTAIVAGMCYGIGWHADMMLLGTPSAASWATFFVLIFVGFVALINLGLLLPTFACYRFPAKQALGNTVLLNCISVLPSILVSIIAVALMLLNLLGGFVSYLIAALMLVLGFMFYALLYTDYAQFCFDAYVTPQVDPDHPDKRRAVTVRNAKEVKKEKSNNPYAKQAPQGKKSGPQQYGKYRASGKKSKKRRR